MDFGRKILEKTITDSRNFLGTVPQPLSVVLSVQMSEQLYSVLVSKCGQLRYVSIFRGNAGQSIFAE